MRGVIVGAALLATLLATAPKAAEFEDTTGRIVAVPDAPARVFPAGPPAAVLLYALKPEAMLGWPRAPEEADKPFLLPAAAALPELPPLTDRDHNLRLEAVTGTDPDLVLDFGTVNNSYAEQAETVQSGTGVPYLLIGGSFENTPRAVREVGALLGMADRGEMLAAYAEETYALVDATLARVPAGERPRIYLARGKDGLQSGGPSSINAAIIERVGATNVVADDGKGNLVEVALEQVAGWAPDVILTLDAGFAEAEAWQAVPAVAAGQVLVAPSAPFGFIDAPPSLNRLIGLRWLLHKLYPEHAEGDLRAEVRAFYALFYQVELDDAALTGLIGS